MRSRQSAEVQPGSAGRDDAQRVLRGGRSLDSQAGRWRWPLSSTAHRRAGGLGCHRKRRGSPPTGHRVIL